MFSVDIYDYRPLVTIISGAEGSEGWSQAFWKVQENKVILFSALFLIKQSLFITEHHSEPQPNLD